MAKKHTAMQVDLVMIPETSGPNFHYVSNQLPLLPSPLVKLPLGSIRARGWLKHQLSLMTDGMTGRLMELSEYLRLDNGWFGTDEQGWEEQPYWLRGFHDLAILTGEQRLLDEAKRWIEAVLNSADEDGYFGAAHNKCRAGKTGRKTADLWPHMVMLDALIHHHEHRADPRVIPLMTGFFRFCRGLPDEMFLPFQPDLGEEFGSPGVKWQTMRAGDMLPHIYWLYNHTGDAWLLDLATRFFQRIPPPEDEWLDHHAVNFTQRFRYPGTFYVRSGQHRHMASTDYWFSQHMSTWGQQPRGIFGADERIRPGHTDPRQALETCAIVEFAKSFYILGRITGDPLYANRCEDIMLNHFPASQTPDLKGLHYLTASNQPQLDASTNHDYLNEQVAKGNNMITYSPHRYRCCQHNVAMGWPWYVQNLWQATADNGLAAWMYAASDVTARVGEGGDEVTVHADTDYPFNGKVEMHLEAGAPVEFPLYLRVPHWCDDFKVAVNGRAVDVEPVSGLYVAIRRRWKDGDAVAVEMGMAVSLTEWPRTGSVTVDRGPLSYSIKIEEQWRRCGGTDEWPEMEVLPTTPWNYGLIVDPDCPAESLEVSEKGPVADQPWTVETAPIEIKALAKRIPNWNLENETVAELQPSPVRSDEPEERITLIPLGCARLRMSCLPTIGEAPEARQWE